jgi:hypothetical protein
MWARAAGLSCIRSQQISGQHSAIKTHLPQKCTKDAKELDICRLVSGIWLLLEAPGLLAELWIWLKTADELAAKYQYLP